MPGTFLYCPNPPDVVGAVTPVASEVISLLLVRILQHVVPFQQLLEGPMEVFLCERVNDVHHSLFHVLNCLITTASGNKQKS